jgi:alpha-amylase
VLRRLTIIALALILALQGTALAFAQIPAASPMASPVAEQGGQWWQGATCYEIFVRSFMDSDGDGIGDFPGLTSQLDYLNDGVPGEGDDLGVTCIWLMPIMESPSYHGYDVTDYETIEPDYGTNDDFLHFMEEAHARGIRVIIDLPINHTSSDHPWFQEAISDENSPYRDWYVFEDENPGYPGPWGQQVWHSTPGGDDYYYGIFVDSMPDLNFENPDVNEEVRRITEFWLTEMGVDGFRMDAIKHVIEDGRIQENTPATMEWLVDYAAFVRSVKPDAYTVGEVMGSGTDGLLPYYPDTLDHYFQFELAQAMVNTSNFGSARTLIPLLQRTYDTLPDQRWGTFLTNHDQPRYTSQVEEPERQRVGAMMLLSFPGTPYIYYGEEIGMPGDKPDPNIRTPMQWTPQRNGGFTTGIPYTDLQPGWEETNVALQTDDPDSLLSTYRAWSQAREVHPTLQTGTFAVLESEDRSILAFVRQHEEETLLVLINPGANPTEELTFTVPDGITGPTTDIFTGEPGPSINDDGILTLPPLDGRSGTILKVGD